MTNHQTSTLYRTHPRYRATHYWKKRVEKDDKYFHAHLITKSLTQTADKRWIDNRSNEQAVRYIARSFHSILPSSPCTLLLLYVVYLSRSLNRCSSSTAVCSTSFALRHATAVADVAVYLYLCVLRPNDRVVTELPFGWICVEWSVRAHTDTRTRRRRKKSLMRWIFISKDASSSFIRTTTEVQKLRAHTKVQQQQKKKIGGAGESSLLSCKSRREKERRTTLWRVASLRQLAARQVLVEKKRMVRHIITHWYWCAWTDQFKQQQAYMNLVKLCILYIRARYYVVEIQQESNGES